MASKICNFATKVAKLLHLGKKRNEFLLFCTRFFVTLQLYSYNTKNKLKC